VEEIDGERGPKKFLFKSNNIVYQLMTGPRWYLWKIGLTLKEGEAVEVTGSKLLDKEGNLILLLYDVRKTDTGELYQFRGNNMKPLWKRKNIEN
jgi:hypothetical protein